MALQEARDPLSRSDEQLERIGLTRAQWEQFGAAYAAREERAPRVGAIAPDFALPRLEDRATLVRLAAFRGVQPVALIFGSYT